MIRIRIASLALFKKKKKKEKKKKKKKRERVTNRLGVRRTRLRFSWSARESNPGPLAERRVCYQSHHRHPSYLTIYLSIYISIYLYVCPYIYLPIIITAKEVTVCYYRRLFVFSFYLSVCLSIGHQDNSKTALLISIKFGWQVPDPETDFGSWSEGNDLIHFNEIYRMCWCYDIDEHIFLYFWNDSDPDPSEFFASLYCTKYRINFSETWGGILKSSVGSYDVLTYENPRMCFGYSLHTWQSPAITAYIIWIWMGIFKTSIHSSYIFVNYIWSVNGSVFFPFKFK